MNECLSHSLGGATYTYDRVFSVQQQQLKDQTLQLQLSVVAFNYQLL